MSHPAQSRPRRLVAALAACLPLLAATPVALADGHPARRDPRLAIGLNVMQPAIYGIASSFFDASYFVPVPVEAQLRISPRWGLAGTLEYLAHKDGDLKVNGLQLALGPRVTLLGQGLRGLYAALKIGLGFTKGHDYFNASYYRVGLQVQPELGYALAWPPSGLFLAFGLGLRASVTLTESDHAQWMWNGLGAMINYYLPLVNVTVGFDI